MRELEAMERKGQALRRRMALLLGVGGKRKPPKSRYSASDLEQLARAAR